MDLSSSPLLLKLSLIVGPIGFLVYIIGLSTNYWTSTKVEINLPGIGYISKSFHNGLWSSCSEDICGKINNVQSWLGAVQAFIIIGLLLEAASIILSFLLVFVGSLRRKLLFILGLALAWAGVVSIALSLAIYGGEVPDNMDWSFILTIISVPIFVLYAIFVTVSFIQNKASLN